MSRVPSYAAFAKTIVAHIAPMIQAAGFRKRRNAFNRRLENGLVHHLSLRLMSATGSLHGKFVIEGGCYVPEAELYHPTDPNPEWISIFNCCIVEHFVKVTPSARVYLDAKLHAQDPVRTEPYVAQALDAFENVRAYDQIMYDGHDIAPLHFQTPRGIVQTCIAQGQGEKAAAKQHLARYLKGCEACERPKTGHIRAVREWGESHGLL